VGAVEAALSSGMSEDYKSAVRAWQARAAVLGRNLGVVRGAIQHHWHSAKALRCYTTRHAVPTVTKFSPLLHTSMDSCGMLQLSSAQSHDAADLRLRLGAYFSIRDDDSTCTHAMSK
jgi:hypothetical protein